MSEDGEKRRWKRPPSDGKTDGRRTTAERVKGDLKPSSRAWVERQINDPYVQRTQAEGWRARSAFKLIELDDKFGFLRKGQRILDLGAAPGGWAQVAVKRGAARIVGIDLLPIDPLPGATFLMMDFLDPAAPAALQEELGGPPDVVMSDMAANTTGHRATDQIKTGALAEAAAQFAVQVLAPGGTVVTKAFQGGLDAALLADLKQRFATVKHAKPPASRPESPEIYVVAQGFRGER